MLRVRKDAQDSLGALALQESNSAAAGLRSIFDLPLWEKTADKSCFYY